MSNIGEPQRIIHSEPIYDPVPLHPEKEPVHEPEPEKVPADHA